MTGDKTDYVSVVYDEHRAPPGTYPDKLATHLCDRFGLFEGNRLLEIGIGRGDFLAAFSRLGLEVAGVDRELNELSALRGISADLKRCDIAKDALPYPDNSFDVVYHKSVIEHVYDPLPLMRESMRILKPGGKLIILTPDWHSQYKVFFEDFTHCRPYDVQSLADLLKICGVRNSGSELFRQLPVLWSSPWLLPASAIVGFFIPVPFARKLTKLTGVSFIRWSSEKMVLGYGEK